MTPRTLSQDISDHREAADRMLAKLAKEPIEATEKVDPMHPMEAKEPTDPIDRVEPVDPMDSRLSREAIDQREFDMPPSSMTAPSECHLSRGSVPGPCPCDGPRLWVAAA